MNRRTALLAFTTGIAFAGAAAAQDASLGQIPGPYGDPITIDRARRLIAAGMADARSKNFLMAFAVVDPAGDLVAFERMDGVQSASVDVARAKARSAARFRRPTLYWSQALGAGNLSGLTIDGVVGSEGGVPLVNAQGRVIGALGVSGGTAAQDGQVAAAAIAGVR